MSQRLDFPTHWLKVEPVPYSEYIRVTNYVQGKVYDDMVDVIIMQHNPRIRFVAFERILLNNFFRSLLSCHFESTVNIRAEIPQFHVFSEEIDYYHFCVDHNIEFEEQKWYNTAYIKTDLDTAIFLLNKASVTLIQTLYPEYRGSLFGVYKKYTDVFKEPEESRYKYDPKKYQAFLDKYDIKALYHFTDARNVESIRKNGLCSINYLRNHSLDVHYSSTLQSRSIDASKDLADYVHLSYERNNPMLFVALAEGRLYDYRILDVAVDVLFWKETKFTKCNAVKTGAYIADNIDYIMDIPFDLFHNKRYDKNSPYKDLFMSEVLVKDVIPIEFISF